MQSLNRDQRVATKDMKTPSSARNSIMVDTLSPKFGANQSSVGSSCAFCCAKRGFVSGNDIRLSARALALGKQFSER